MQIDRKYALTPERWHEPLVNDFDGMTVEEMAHAWNVSEDKLNQFLKGVTISQKDPRTGADLIPWADVKDARAYFWYHDKGAASRLD